jgi:hypothetical protein
MTPDRFVWKWSSHGSYSGSSTYRAFFHGASALEGAKELWSVAAPPKTKFFLWRNSWEVLLPHLILLTYSSGNKITLVLEFAEISKRVDQASITFLLPFGILARH